MPVPITGGAPTLCIRRAAYEKSGLTRPDIDAQLELTADEFRVEGNLLTIGPIYSVSLDSLFERLDAAGLRYYDDYFELTGNWPEWLRVYAASS